MATLKPLQGVQNQSRPAVVFIHGLGGDPIETWRHSQMSSDDFWPHWIGTDTDTAVWTLGYDAALSRWKDQAMPLPDQGDQVADLLGTHPSLSRRPLILVGHSMGGLVIKTAVVHAMTKGKATWRAWAQRLRGVVFIATPHAGSELANLARAMSSLLRTNEQVGNLKIHDAPLRTLNHQFQLQQSQLSFRSRTFAERRALVLPRRWFGLLPGISIRIVDDTSAEYGSAGESAVPLAEDHLSICKPSGRDQQIHASTCEFIKSLELDPVVQPVMPAPRLQSAADTPGQLAPGQLRGSTDNRLFPREGFVCGREREIGQVLAFLRSQHHSAAICAQAAGAGGIGKTEVCKAALGAWLAERPDAIAYYIDVPDNTAPGELPPRIGRALGFEGIEDLPALSQRMPPGLYYLDNMESVAETIEGQALLRALQIVPGVRLLMSSRVSLPGVMGQLIEIDALQESPALELFRKLWAGRDALPKDDILTRFVMGELGGHALSVTLLARLGDCYSYPDLVGRWRQMGTSSADSVDRSRLGSLALSLKLTAQALGTNPGTLDAWTTIALFPGGMPESLLAKFEQQGHWTDARLRLIRYHLIQLRDGRMHMLPPVARHALDSSLNGKEGFDWTRSRLPVLQHFSALTRAAESVKSSDSTLGARRDLLLVFAALLRTMRQELAVLEPERTWIRETHENLLNTYQFRAGESRELLNEMLQKLRPVPTSCLQVLGKLEDRLGAVDTARPLYTQALDLYQKEQDSLGQANTLKSLGDLERRLGAVDAARALYGQARDLYQKEQDGLGQANTLQSLGDLERRLGALDTARALYEQALDLYRREQASLGQANTLKSLGDLERRLGAVDAARALYGQARDLYQKEQDGLGQANTLQSLGDLERRLGALDAARALYEQARDLYQKEQDSLGQANTLQSLGDLERRLGALDAARALYGQALDLFQKEQDGLGQANTLKSLGDLERRLGALDTARALYGQARDLYQREQASLGQANTLKSLGDLERRLGAVDAARELYGQALDLFQKEQDGLGQANTLQSLGDLESQLGAVDAARALYEDALDLFQKEQDSLGQANTLQSLGDLESQRGAMDAGRALYEQALDLFQKEQDDLGQANTFRSLGDLEHRLNAPDKAHLNYSRALELYEFVQEPMGYSYTCTELARCAHASGNQPVAEDFLLKALRASMRTGSERVTQYVFEVVVEILGSREEAEHWVQKWFEAEPN